MNAVNVVLSVPVDLRTWPSVGLESIAWAREVPGRPPPPPDPWDCLLLLLARGSATSPRMALKGRLRHTLRRYFSGWRSCRDVKTSSTAEKDSPPPDHRQQTECGGSLPEIPRAVWPPFLDLHIVKPTVALKLSALPSLRDASACHFSSQVFP
ncbi:hypothetical protein AAG570_008563 [Ranatra chinensis]|uniref:Uncharacterized protein n=1 Tax=Ranatra chinensis TaxID=642074 RepID=A0ABD0YR95_9HEMI